jgi:hypothetical protein
MMAEGLQLQRANLARRHPDATPEQRSDWRIPSRRRLDAHLARMPNVDEIIFVGQSAGGEVIRLVSWLATRRAIRIVDAHHPAQPAFGVDLRRSVAASLELVFKLAFLLNFGPQQRVESVGVTRIAGLVVGGLEAVSDRARVFEVLRRVRKLASGPPAIVGSLRPGAIGFRAELIAGRAPNVAVGAVHEETDAEPK